MAVTIQVVAQARVGHFAEAQVPKAAAGERDQQPTRQTASLWTKPKSPSNFKLKVDRGVTPIDYNKEDAA